MGVEKVTSTVLLLPTIKVMTAYKVLQGDILLIVFDNTITVLLKHEQDRRRVPNYRRASW